MPVVVITRLRLRDPALFDDFFQHAVAAVEQAQKAAGNVAADVMADADNVYWTRTAWEDREKMHAFVGTEPHLSTMRHIDAWCDEATFVSWDQGTPDLPSWQDGYERLVAEGQATSISDPTAAHLSRSFPAPVAAS